MTKSRLASGPQLWTLNESGRLKIVHEAEPITATIAFHLVAEIKSASDSGKLLESLTTAELGSARQAAR